MNVRYFTQLLLITLYLDFEERNESVGHAITARSLKIECPQALLHCSLGHHNNDNFFTITDPRLRSANYDQSHKLLSPPFSQKFKEDLIAGCCTVKTQKLRPSQRGVHYAQWSDAETSNKLKCRRCLSCNKLRVLK